MSEMRLDATAGLRRWWKGKDTSDMVFMDIKSVVEPTVVADARKLPFRSSLFSEVWCDPPHLIRRDLKNWTARRAKDLLCFGNFKNRESWISFLFKTNNEFHRVLKPIGKLVFKVTDGKDRRVTKVSDVRRFMTNFDEKKNTSWKSKAPWSSNRTYILEFERKT